MASVDATRAVETVWRIESARLIAGLARIVGDVGLAEDLAVVPHNVVHPGLLEGWGC